jgi:flagellar protein FlbT
MHISLRPDEKLYINGAVIRVDRKVTIELLNDVTFLLESHVMLAKDANTPLRQIYFIVQMMLMDPSETAAARRMFEQSIMVLLAEVGNAQFVTALKEIQKLVGASRYFEALKKIRKILPEEAIILAQGKPAPIARAS